MEIYKNIGFEVHVDELAYDLGYTGYAIVYRPIFGKFKIHHLFFGEDLVFSTRGEASMLLKNIAEQYIELEFNESGDRCDMMIF
jgi:hypothetical protein